ncbi:hypothetical protein ACQ0QQ_14435 [Lysinibacillus sphaericus]
MTERSVRQGDFLTAEEAVYHQNAFVFPVFLLKIDKLVFEESRQEAKLRGFMMESHSESGFHATFSTLQSTFRIYVQLLQNTFQFSKLRATFHFYEPLRIILICLLNYQNLNAQNLNLSVLAVLPPSYKWFHPGPNCIQFPPSPTLSTIMRILPCPYHVPMVN